MRLFAIAVVAIALGQPAAPPLGDWTASYRGTTFVRLTLTDSAAGPQGTISIGQSIHVDEAGNVDSATPASSTLTRIFDARWNGTVLSFVMNDGGDTNAFELRPTDPDHADLALILSEAERQELVAERVPLPKPFHLTKTR